MKLLDSGHILGARAICVGDEVFYTGDAAGRDRAFMGKCRTKKARVLITESTFGKSNYVFPPIEQIAKEVNSTIGDALRQGEARRPDGVCAGQVADTLPPLLLLVPALPARAGGATINDVYIECGDFAQEGKGVSADLAGLPQGPWVMIAPMMSSRNRVARSGSRRSTGRRSSPSAAGPPTRDMHTRSAPTTRSPSATTATIRSCMSLVHDVSPEIVYTTHGFTQEFASDLRKQGFDAKPLAGYQTFISEY